MPETHGAKGLARIQALFEAALEEPLSRRTAYLEERITDSKAREEVRRLLEAHTAEGPLDDIVAALAGIGGAHVEAGPGEMTTAAPGRSGGRGSRNVEPPRQPHRIGPYRIHEPIGRGGMAEVYRARRLDDDTAPWVALKLLRPEADSTRVRRRFTAERQILAGLDHENIARLLDDGLTSTGLPYLVTELVEGQRVDRHCEGHGIDLAGRLRLFLEACRAVEYAHDRGVVHRDLKPDNVLVTGKGRVSLLDFGIAKILDRQAFPGTAATTSGVHLLTLTYASPEQLGAEAITPASDIYQLGLLLMKIVTGRAPPLHERWPQPRGLELQWPPTAYERRRVEHIEVPLRRLLGRALSLRPEDRHASVGELIRDIRTLPTA